jgi:hypothetical protein
MRPGEGFRLRRGRRCRSRSCRGRPLLGVFLLSTPRWARPPPSRLIREARAFRLAVAGLSARRSRTARESGSPTRFAPISLPQRTLRHVGRRTSSADLGPRREMSAESATRRPGRAAQAQTPVALTRGATATHGDPGPSGKVGREAPSPSGDLRPFYQPSPAADEPLIGNNGETRAAFARAALSRLVHAHAHARQSEPSADGPEGATPSVAPTGGSEGSADPIRRRPEGPVCSGRRPLGGCRPRVSDRPPFLLSRRFSGGRYGISPARLGLGRAKSMPERRTTCRTNRVCY